MAAFLSSDFFKALGDRNRLAILASLVEGGEWQSVSEIASRCPVDLSVVSRHLAILARQGIMESRRQGKAVFYRVRTTQLVAFLRGMADALEQCCAANAAKPE